MNKLVASSLLVMLLALPGQLSGQPGSKPSPAASATTKKESAAAKKESKQTTGKSESDSSSKGKGAEFNAGVTGPITTEIYADEAFFDSNKSVGIFRGHVKVNDPRFNLQSDKLTAFISKAQARQAGQEQAAQPGAAAQTGGTAEAAKTSPGQTGTPGQGAQASQAAQGQGLEKAIAEGNVALVRDRPDPNGGPPTRAVGRAETATYVAATGDVELKGSPRVQQGLNTHIGTSPDTVMVINQNGQLTTHGPSRTEIRQEPKDENAEGEKGDKKAGAKDEKKSPQPSPKK